MCRRVHGPPAQAQRFSLRPASDNSQLAHTGPIPAFAEYGRLRRGRLNASQARQIGVEDVLSITVISAVMLALALMLAVSVTRETWGRFR